MVLSIIAFTIFTGDNAPSAAITTPRRRYGKFSIITALLKRQAALEIAEHRAVALVGKRPAFFDQLQSRSRFTGQFLDGNLFDRGPWLIMPIDGHDPVVEYEKAD